MYGHGATTKPRRGDGVELGQRVQLDDKVQGTQGQGRVRKRVERVVPRVFDIMPQRDNHVADVIVRRRLCPKRCGMARLIYG